jgi:hypothetical protein
MLDGKEIMDVATNHQRGRLRKGMSKRTRRANRVGCRGLGTDGGSESAVALEKDEASVCMNVEREEASSLSVVRVLRGRS